MRKKREQNRDGETRPAGEGSIDERQGVQTQSQRKEGRTICYGYSTGVGGASKGVVKRCLSKILCASQSTTSSTTNFETGQVRSLRRGAQLRKKTEGVGVGERSEGGRGGVGRKRETLEWKEKQTTAIAGK